MAVLLSPMPYRVTRRWPPPSAAMRGSRDAGVSAMAGWVPWPAGWQSGTAGGELLPDQPDDVAALAVVRGQDCRSTGSSTVWAFPALAPARRRYGPETVRIMDGTLVPGDTAVAVVSLTCPAALWARQDRVITRRMTAPVGNRLASITAPTAWSHPHHTDVSTASTAGTPVATIAVTGHRQYTIFRFPKLCTGGLVMVQRLRRVATYVTMVLVAITSVIVITQGSAQAGTLECTTPGTVELCVNISADDISVTLTGKVIGSEASSFNDWTLIIIQCSGTGSNCGALRASSDADSDEWGEFVSKHASGSFGHTYKAVASWTESPSGARQTSISTPLACCPA